ncbi:MULTISPECIES: hypothetical protein [unclassified Streptomyces]|uniref:hypothetical protein n=1 Tax=unclassified Streptomyces TaxID=2593676 RepID=UPI001DC4B7D9|nr:MULTISPECIES: hypothetical protein [unclassified Streptomyces]MBD0711130.1 hypothetical protein [Streptomyces sp. CBMA291]MBD0714161.1 hypothetical protein [Streptomyces sp. CBMA370]
MAVLERTSEIGLRRALGARGRRITTQFLTKSATLGSRGPRWCLPWHADCCWSRDRPGRGARHPFRDGDNRARHRPGDWSAGRPVSGLESFPHHAGGGAAPPSARSAAGMRHARGPPHVT